MEPGNNESPKGETHFPAFSFLRNQVPAQQAAHKNNDFKHA